MNRTDYPAFVKKIWTEPGEQTERGLSIAGLGLIGECGEVCEILLQDVSFDFAAQLVDECGDVLYYATVLADWKGWHIEDVWPQEPTLIGDITKEAAGLMLCRDGKEVSERVKKFIRDGADPTPTEMMHRLHGVLVSLERVLSIVGADLFDAMEFNVKKLEVRYAHAL